MKTFLSSTNLLLLNIKVKYFQLKCHHFLTIILSYTHSYHHFSCYNVSYYAPTYLHYSDRAMFSTLQAKHKVSKLVHTAKCKFCTEGIALASSSKELHQIVNTLSNRHPPRILPTIYPSADLSSIFIKHFTNKVEKL